MIAAETNRTLLTFAILRTPFDDSAFVTLLDLFELSILVLTMSTMPCPNFNT